MHQQGAAVTTTTHLWLHKQIFQVKTGATKPGGEIKKINGEPNGFGIFKRDHHFRRRLRAEKHFMQTFLGCDYVIGRALVRREIADQLQNDWNVRDGSVTNLKVSPIHFWFVSDE